MRPELWATLAALMDSLQPPGAGLRLDRVELDLPLELALRGRGDAARVLGSPPRWRWPTAFDARPARLRMTLRPERVPSLPLPAEGA